MTRREVRPDPVGEGQESVWDYPRPPALVPSDRHVVIRLGSTVIAETRRAWRVLETSHPPAWYVPREDVTPGVLRRSSATATVCEWKGEATYWDVVLPDGVVLAALWSYESPTVLFAELAGRGHRVPGPTGVPGRWEAGSPAGGRLLRWLDHRRRGRPVQGRPRDLGLVTGPGSWLR